MEFYNDMLYLSLCALKDVEPDIARVEKIDLEKLYNSCQEHKITALVCYALESVLEPSHQWLEAKGKAIRKNMLFDVERQQIVDFMNKNGIKHMPLKGILLQEYYPKLGMRQMSDNDIYYDIHFRQKLEEFMIRLGYECTEKSDNHDAYEKKPIYNFEFHHKLFLKETSKTLYKYYLDIENRMIKDEDASCGYHLSNEDLYIYLIAHEYKHYTHFGTGIRSLLDCVVMLENFSSTLDWDYIRCETVKAGISDFEEKQRKLCQKLATSFDNAQFTQEEVEFLKFLISSGAYGAFRIGVLNRARGEAGERSKITFGMKAKYILRRIFPPMHYYKRLYPFFYKHRYLLPLCFFYRLYKAVFKRSKSIKNEIDILNKSD